jgi:hypothetical protein
MFAIAEILLRWVLAQHKKETKQSVWMQHNHLISNGLRPIPDTHYLSPNTPYPVPDTQHPVHNTPIQDPVPNTQDLIPSTLYPSHYWGH